MEWPLYNFIESYAESHGVYNYLPLFFESMSSIWDYFRTADIFCVGDIQTPIKNYQKLIEQRFNNQNDSEQPNLNPSELFFDASQTIRKIKRMDPIITRGFMLKSKGDSHKSASKGEGYVSTRSVKK